MVTRFPIVAAEPMDRAALDRMKQDTPPGIRGAGYVVRYTLATPGGPINVTNLHLETARKGFEGLMAGDVERLCLNTRVRSLESTLARRWTDAGRSPTIVAGDFNTPVESRIFQDQWGDFADAFTRVGVGFGQTKHNGWIRIRIDHVLTDEAWHPVKAWVWRDVGSDHRAMVVDLMLVRAPGTATAARAATVGSAAWAGPAAAAARPVDSPAHRARRCDIPPARRAGTRARRARAPRRAPPLQPLRRESARRSFARPSDGYSAPTPAPRARDAASRSPRAPGSTPPRGRRQCWRSRLPGVRS
jgi:hypothetical protein